VGVVDDDARTQDPCLSANNTDITKKYWFFGYLMTQMTSGTDYSGFARSWLKSWETSTTLKGDPLVEVKPTPGAGVESSKPIATRIREAWERKSGSTTLAMSKAPFRLLAIVNRFDLRKSPRRFNEGASGELRFVFSALNLDQGCAEYGTPNDLSFRGQELVILEYAVDISTAAAKRTWITSWTDLTNFQPGTEEFNSRLQNLTQQVVVKGKGAGTGRANGSALIRIRTNETANALQWDLREFEINSSTHLVVPASVKQTPRDDLNCKLFKNQNRNPACSTTVGANDLTRWVRDNGSSILADTYKLPDQFPAGYTTRNLIGAHSNNDVANTFWPGSSSNYTIPGEVRHQFSKNTCSGCHSIETGTAFFHVHGREKGSPSNLSPFLTGYQCDGGIIGCGAEITGGPHCVTDPVDPNTQRCFGELDKRALDILSFLNTGI
jgi:hypothetical protein